MNYMRASPARLGLLFGDVDFVRALHSVLDLLRMPLRLRGDRWRPRHGVEVLHVHGVMVVIPGHGVVVV